MTISLKQLGIYIGLLAIGTGSGFWGHQQLHKEQQNSLQPSQLIPATLPTLSLAKQANEPSVGINFIAEAVRQVGPSVVRIDASRTIASPFSDSLEQPFFRRFFGQEGEKPSPRQLQRGTGSGFILTANGRLVTNAHVVEGADIVKVTLKDGRALEGKVVGRDSVTDVAAIEIDAKNLPAVTLGNSETLIPGEWAIAIGNPLGLDNTVTVGIISATGRSSSQVGVPDKRVRFIQTDAAINPGNSGGPLLNAKGEVIGINTAIRADAQGLGFAIPIETAKRIANQLFAEGKADHPYLGVQMITLNADRRDELNQNPDQTFVITSDRGIIVMGVIPNSPADRGGFQVGDIIVKVGGNAVSTATDVQQQVELSQIGKPLKIEVNRQGRVINIQVLPEAFPVSDR
ncbi:HhoA/HhoB/HtrA family serine endopeptidase [Spirulina sp. 06S082]|uniref:HhoA/HhoB/HtrA family serine endopeptidase n=1 Tax=Spirulina sp. 06S082 TaxID=3110248 RepID=UPI002B1F03EF|nr:HhoA/HhoB/HtrA family serine endopeptidase [Spirulina sp. 06S082]MEA5468329.1 HhoA/HhoB/HtrA family serine endopeptidase [Spirulina sp. 06S082]